MTNAQLTLIIIALLAIIPACVSFVVLWTRMIDQNTRINAALGGREDISRVEQKQKDVDIAIAKLKTDFAGLEESFSNLNNKIIARNSREKKTERKEEAEEKPDFEQEELLQFPAVNRQPAQPAQPARLIMRTKQL